MLLLYDAVVVGTISSGNYRGIFFGDNNYENGVHSLYGIYGITNPMVLIEKIRQTDTTTKFLKERWTDRVSHGELQETLWESPLQTKRSIHLVRKGTTID